MQGYIVNDDDNQVVRCNVTAGVPPAEVWCKDTLGPYIQFNPIEQVFSMMKSQYRAYRSDPTSQ